MKTLNAKLSDPLAPVFVIELNCGGFEKIVVEEGCIVGFRDPGEGADLICRIEQRDGIGPVYTLSQFGRICTFTKIEITICR